MVDKVSLAMDLVRSELKRAEGRVTVTIACQHPHFMQQQQAAQDAIHGKTSAHPGQIQTQPNGQESPTLRQMQGVESPHQSQLCRQEEEGLPSRELQQHKFVLVELLSDNYRDVMSQTLVGVESDLKLCRHLLQQCKESFSSMVSYYGENAQAFANDAVFWSDVITFVDSFTACQKQLRQQIQVIPSPLSYLRFASKLPPSRLYPGGALCKSFLIEQYRERFCNSAAGLWFDCQQAACNSQLPAE